MPQPIEINAELRSDVGKGASRRLRRQGDRVPGIIYGGSDGPVNLSVAQNELIKVMEGEAFFSQILSVSLDGKKSQAVVRDLQRHPASNKVLHLDFLRVSADKLVEINVPLHFINEEDCVGARMEEGIIMHALSEVEVSCLPAALPQFIEVDMTDVHVGDSIHLSDLTMPEGVELVALMHDETDRNVNVVSVQLPRGGMEEEEAELEAAAEGEVEGEGAGAGEGEGEGEGAGEAGED